MFSHTGYRADGYNAGYNAGYGTPYSAALAPTPRAQAVPASVPTKLKILTPKPAATPVGASPAFKVTIKGLGQPAGRPANVNAAANAIRNKAARKPAPLARPAYAPLPAGPAAGEHGERVIAAAPALAVAPAV